MTIMTGVRKHIARCLGLVGLCLLLSAAPAMAQRFGISQWIFDNWWGYHNVWAQHCYYQPRYGHWGREQRWNSWCVDNVRFRYERPDARWRHDHPWDYGRRGDHH
jgi:hypothetical protein